MDNSIFSILIETLPCNNREVLSELLDAIGFMAFYNPIVVTPKNASYVYEIFKVYPSDSLLVWKALLCLSAFPFSTSEEILQSYIHHPITLLQQEAKRSLRYMK